MKLKKVIKVSRPYLRKDGRKHVCVTYEDNTRGSISYPKYLVEQHLGRRLDPEKETIDHIDGDFTNDDFKNLRIIPRGQHVSEDVKRYKIKILKCIWCNRKFKVDKPRDRINSKKNGCAGPFCSRKCRGSYGAELQNKRIDKLSYKYKMNKSFYKKKKKIVQTVKDI